MGSVYNDLTTRIREDWGTLRHFCKVHGINDNTLRVVRGGHGKSARVVKVLKDAGYIESEEDIYVGKAAER